MLKKILMVLILFFVPAVMAAQNDNQSPYQQMQVAANKVFSTIN